MRSPQSNSVKSCSEMTYLRDSSSNTMSKNLSSNVFSIASCVNNLGDGMTKSQPGSAQHSRCGSNYSANSAKSLSDEGFSKRRESENEKMWKMVETLRNKSSLLKAEREKQKLSSMGTSSGGLVQMEIIEEDVI